MRIERRRVSVIDLQIGPMVDLIFLLLFFFMIQPQPAREAELGLELPGTVTQEEAVPLPDEQRIAIQSNGAVTLNDLPVGAPGDRDLSQLRAILVRFKETCDANKSPALITIDPEDDVVHQRITDVLNACARAGIRGVTFSGVEEGADDLNGS